MHLRRVKADKMADIMRTTPHTAAPPIPARAPSYLPYPSSNNIPYPTGSPINMPHPPY
jgi:hypothetical protein